MASLNEENILYGQQGNTNKVQVISTLKTLVVKWSRHYILFQYLLEAGQINLNAVCYCSKHLNNVTSNRGSKYNL